MLILSIDTTGFSSSIALVKDSEEVVFNKTSSGFVSGKNWWDFPYLLPSFHQEFILKNIDKINWKEIDAIAVSANSGIYNCIIVGTSIAYALGKTYQKPIIEVDHLLAHIYSSWLERNPNNFQFPVLVFSASGSHSDFALIKNEKECRILYGVVPKQDRGGVETFLGIGKVFYQFGRALKIITPNDAGIDRLTKAALKGSPGKFDFIKYYKGELLDLNFSNFMDSIVKFYQKKRKPSKQFISDVAASFQESITEILANKILKTAQVKKAREIHIAGGLSMNKYLEKKLRNKSPIIIRYPVKKEYRLDNAAMIGALAYYMKRYKIVFRGFQSNITK